MYIEEQSEKTLHKKQDRMFEIIYTVPEQFQHAAIIGKNIVFKHQNKNHIPTAIIFAGMGGSGAAGDFVSLLLKDNLTIPYMVTKSYTLAPWINEQTLVILASYSGMTEETIACFNQAQAKKAHIIGITSGGELARLLTEHGHTSVIIPDGLPPRMATGYLAIPLLYALYVYNILPLSLLEEIEHAINYLYALRAEFSAENQENSAYHYAQKLINMMPIIYGEHTNTALIAQRWRAQFAENSKILSFVSEIPECNHNELESWHQPYPLMQPIWLIDPVIHVRNKIRMQLMQQIMQAKHIIIESQGKTAVERLLYLWYLGDWLSYWLAYAQNRDALSIETITQFKHLMQQA